jgi:2'-5' RNA ligase
MQADIGRLAGATETGVIVPVAAAERVVGRFRRAVDHSAAWGVPAHVTVLYPFVPPGRIDTGTIERIGAALAEVPAFSCTFSQVKWFGEDAPHLTIGSVAIANLESMRRAAVEIQSELPITTRIDHARLVAGSDAPDSWRTMAELPLPG